jgi:hypothetical protein
MTIHRPDTSGHSGPEHEHHILSEREAEQKMHKPVERVHNLGHPTTHDKVHEHPLHGKVMSYNSDDVGHAHMREGQRPGRGVYGRSADPKSGLSTAENLSDWSRYSTSNSYHGKDPAGRGEGSDGHLASTDKWANLPDAGGDSGVGRLEKAKR